MTNAQPKIANYHFTTLSPNLGVVDLEDSRGFVIADIPGLIEGASQGRVWAMSSFGISSGQKLSSTSWMRRGWRAVIP